MTMVSQSSTAGETVFKIPSGLEETREKKRWKWSYKVYSLLDIKKKCGNWFAHAKTNHSGDKLKRNALKIEKAFQTLIRTKYARKKKYSFFWMINN